MEPKVFVRGFPPETTEDELKKFFDKLADVRQARIVKNFAFVTFQSLKDAEKAAEKFHGKNFYGHRTPLVVQVTRPRTKNFQSGDRDGQRSNLCYNCQKQGHRKFQCPQMKNKIDPPSNRQWRKRSESNQGRQKRRKSRSRSTSNKKKLNKHSNRKKSNSSRSKSSRSRSSSAGKKKSSHHQRNKYSSSRSRSNSSSQQSRKRSKKHSKKSISRQKMKKPQKNRSSPSNSSRSSSPARKPSKPSKNPQKPPSKKDHPTNIGYKDHNERSNGSSYKKKTERQDSKQIARTSHKSRSNSSRSSGSR